MGVTINNDTDSNKDDKDQTSNELGVKKDAVTNANPEDGAPVPDLAEGSHTAGGPGATSIGTSAENVNPVPEDTTPTSHAKTPPEMVEDGVVVDSINQAAAEPVSAAGSVSAESGAVDQKTFEYRVAAWFANVTHKLTEDEKKFVIKLKADLAKRFESKAKEDGADLLKHSKELEQEAAKAAQGFKDKYIQNGG